MSEALISSEGFGALGSVALSAQPGGKGPGSFGWSGGAGTTAFVDRSQGIRVAGYGQFIPSTRNVLPTYNREEDGDLRVLSGGRHVDPVGGPTVVRAGVDTAIGQRVGVSRELARQSRNSSLSTGLRNIEPEGNAERSPPEHRSTAGHRRCAALDSPAVMPNLDTEPERRLARTDRLLPISVLQGSEEQARSARILLTGVVAACAIALLFSLLHLSNNELDRALFSVLCCIPLLGSLLLLWGTGRVEPGVHLVLALCTAMVIFSPFVTGEGDPAFPALMIVPIGAALMSGVRAGAIWSILITAVLAIYASQYPFPESVRKLVWLSAIMAAGGGLAATLIESARERARKDAEAAALVRELAESALVESQALFELAFRSSTAILCLISLETGKILDVNETFTRISGWSHAEAVGKSLGELNAWIGPDDRQQIFDQLMAKGGIDAVELQMRSKHGDLVWLRGSAETLQQQGRACLLIEMADVTEAKRNNEALKRYRMELEERYAERGEQLQESRAQLRQLDRLAAVGTLAAGVAHQINNPIGGIVAAAEFAAVMDDQPDRETIRTEALATALNEAKRCGRIVKNILKFSRDEPTVKWVEDLTSIVAGATELARTHVIKQGGRLDMNLAVCPLPILASTIDIEQVVLNLIYNASESKLDGADIIVETALHGEFAEISVSDNGAGIDPERRPYIFEPFYTSRVDQGGSGLGLSVVHGIVGDHGGELEIDDVPTGGTRVRVFLPLSTDASNPTS